MRDYLVDQSFRRDVLVREGTVINAKVRQRNLLRAPFALAHPGSQVNHRPQSPIGEIAFDNPIARHIVRVLARGLADLVAAP